MHRDVPRLSLGEAAQPLAGFGTIAPAPPASRVSKKTYKERAKSP
jgi:hypothetical protein